MTHSRCEARRRWLALVSTSLGVLAAVVPLGAASSQAAEPTSVTVDLPASADTYVYADAPTSNFGSAGLVKQSAIAYRGLLEFDTSSIPAGSVVTAANLTVQAENSPSLGGIVVHPSAGGWDEDAVTWQTRPAWDATVLASSVLPVLGSAVAVSLPASAVSVGAPTDFALAYTPSGIISRIGSRENGDPAVLEVTYASSTGVLAPLTDTGAATNVTGTSATVSGTVNPNGDATSCHFDYGLTAAYGSATSTQQVGAGQQPVDVSDSLSGLTAGTTYHYQLSCTNSAGTTSGTDATLTTNPVSGGGGDVTKVLTIVEENHGYNEMLSQMPYLAGLAHQYGYASNYHALTHPSLPNYLALAAGSTFGVTTDCSVSSCPQHGLTVFDQAIAAGGSGKIYAEDMIGNCETSGSGSGDYAARHTAWPYFVDPTPRANCNADQVPAGSATTGAFHDDVLAGSLPTVGWLIPNLCNDAHDCSLATADDWLKQMIPLVMSGPDWKSGHLAIVVTADEDDGSNGNQVLTVVIHPDLSGVVVTTRLDHYSLTRFQEQVAGVSAYLNNAASAVDLAAAFGLTAGP